MKTYDSKTFSWGYELEVGDVNRKLDLPECLGSWEYAETDIVNQREPYRYRAADPLGIDPPVGGEINIVPTMKISQQVDKIKALLAWFKVMECRPTVSSSVMEAHIHVHVPGLIEDIDALKRLTYYIDNNQDSVIKHCVQYKEHPLMKLTKTARTYLKWDMGRTMPEYMSTNIANMATNFDDFIRLQCCGKDGVSRGRPFRYAINTYCLKHTRTIEFRCFRATLDLDLIKSCFMFVKRFMECALNNGPPVESYVKRYKFPPFVYDHEEYRGWESTKWDKSRGKKARKFIPIR